MLEKKQSIKTTSEMKEMIALADKDIKGYTCILYVQGTKRRD